jgi:hypothetical protein
MKKLAALALLTACARPETMVAAQAQAQQEPPPVIRLAPGQRYSHGPWDLEVQNLFMAPSPHRARYSEVRMTVAFRNTSGVEIVFGRAALGDNRALYPQLQLRDSSGVVHPLPLERPQETSVAGSNLGSVPPGVTARWTVGFQVPTIYTAGLAAEAIVDGQVVAAWDLNQGPQPLAGWSPPEGMATSQMGSGLDWTDELRVTPVGYGSTVCGNPAVEHAVLIFGLQFLVENLSFTDALWPGTKYPEVPAIGIWGDGGSAHFATETFFGSPDPLNRHSFEEVVIPPQLDPDGSGTVAPPEARGMIFPLPRDGRLGGVDLPPQAVILYPPAPDADPIWVSITGSPSLALSPAFCDRYTPGVAYTVRP